MSRSQPRPQPPPWRIVDWNPPLLTLEVAGEERSFLLGGSTRSPVVGWCGQTYFPAAAGESELANSAGSAADLCAPMPGTVLEVAVTRGDSVEQGQLLVTVEAMKMELPIRAPRAGIVGNITIAPGDPVEPGIPLVELEEETP